jgi:septal ring-binding cell division protein DamX
LAEPPPTAASPAPTAAPATPAAVPSSPAADPRSRGLGPLTTARLSASQDWLKSAPGSHYFIQLLNTSASSAREVESFLATYGSQVDDAQLRVYRSSLSGQDRLGIIYGDFRTRAEAQAAIGELPNAIRATRPHTRQVSRLR